MSYLNSISWREYATDKLRKDGIIGISPMRCKEYLRDEMKISDEYADSMLSNAKAITARDRWDCNRCDCLLVNLIGATQVSIGTILEIGWASGWNIPIVLCIDKCNVHEHCMIRQSCGFVVETLEDGINVVKALFYEPEDE